MQHRQARHEERVNVLTHLAGALAGVAGLVVLLVVAAADGDARKVVSFGIYGLVLVLLYTFSSLYHATRGTWKRVFRKLDHYAIYLLIAGTYTPIALVALRGAWGWAIFGVDWGLAAAGILYETLRRPGPRIVPVFVYLAMGWLALVAIPPLLRAVPAGGLLLLLAGGLFYTGGIAFYALDHRLPYAHGIWHGFVLAGSVSHYLAVLLYVA